MKTIKTVEALYEYLSDNDGELSFRAGDIITITGIADDNWYYGFLRDEWGIMRKGVVAKPYVKVLVTVPPKPGSPHGKCRTPSMLHLRYRVWYSDRFIRSIVKQ